LFDLEGQNAGALAQMGERVAQRKTPFFILVGSGTESELLSQKLAKPTGYLSKPLNSTLVFVNIELALEQRRSAKAKEHKLEELFVKNGKEYVRISTDDILWVQASGNYIEIFTAQEKCFLLRVGLKELEDRLPEQQFIRVHKSYIVNKKHILKFNSAAIRTVMGEIPLARSYFGSVLTAFTVI
jgi:DNA-binding LytR/AlgR family response regulator